MTHKDVRVLLAQRDLRQWQLAKMLEMPESSLSRALRTENITPELEEKIKAALSA